MNEQYCITRPICDKNGVYCPRLTFLTGPYPYFAQNVSHGCHDILKEVINKAAKPGMVCLEVGSYVGESASCFLPTIKENNGVLYCVDIWDSIESLSRLEMYEIFEFNIRTQGFENHVIPLRMTSEEANRCLQNMEFDFVYIDADHRYSYVKNDLEWFYPKVKDGGMIAGHDCEIRFSDCPDPKIIEEYCEIGWYEPSDPRPNWLKYKGFHPGVVKAVNEFFQDKEYNIKDRVFYHFKGQVKCLNQ